MGSAAASSHAPAPAHKADPRFRQRSSGGSGRKTASMRNAEMQDMDSSGSSGRKKSVNWRPRMDSSDYTRKAKAANQGAVQDDEPEDVASPSRKSSSGGDSAFDSDGDSAFDEDEAPSRAFDRAAGP